jgi:hypothetical protein
MLAYLCLVAATTFLSSSTRFHSADRVGHLGLAAIDHRGDVVGLQLADDLVQDIQAFGPRQMVTEEHAF